MMMTTAAKPETEFRVVRQNVLVVRKKPYDDPGDAMSADVFGDVAWLPSRNEHVARWRSLAGFSYGQMDEKAEVVAKNGWQVHPTAWPQFFRAKEELGVVTLSLDDDPEQVERTRFAGMFPYLAKHWDVTPKPRKGLFSPGVIVNSKKPPSLDWRRFLDLHLKGDWGVLGVYDPTPLTDEQQWGLGLLSIPTQSSEGCRRRTVVRSEHVLTRADIISITPPNVERLWPVPHVHIVSLVGYKTLMFTAPPSGAANEEPS